MSLTIYRRHDPGCKVHKIKKLSARAKRFYVDCDCWIWVTGSTDTATYPRQSTKLRDWKAAEAYLRSLVAESKNTTVHGPTIADCVRRFLDSHSEAVSTKTLAQHRLTLGRLEAFAKTHNKSFMRELDVDLLEDFKTYGLPELKSTSKATVVSKLKFFLRESYRRGWTTEALAEKVRSSRAVYEQKQPYSDDEITLILDTMVETTKKEVHQTNTHQIAQPMFDVSRLTPAEFAQWSKLVEAMRPQEAIDVEVIDRKLLES